MSSDNRFFLTAALSLLLALLSGCASSQPAIDYKALGEEACRDNGGLLYIDRINPETAFYACASGMNYKIKKPSPPSAPLQ